ncbi:DUF3179 domain-containing protein [Candidatus Woesearchaeota archaeon]|nr:DUF3179 domain-containing protein [Candidatus Woesearchaeota archaeon]
MSGSVRGQQKTIPKRDSITLLPPALRKLGKEHTHYLALAGTVILSFLLVGLALTSGPEQNRKVLHLDLAKEMIANNLSRNAEFISSHLVDLRPMRSTISPPDYTINNPIYVSAEAADAYLVPDKPIFGVVVGGKAKAYPKYILSWANVVNDKEGGKRFSITYSPLTNSAIAYQGRELGVSEKLYNDNIVLIDRKTGSEIPQMLGMAINGPAKGKQLKPYLVEETTWAQWRAVHPETTVLSPESGSQVPYTLPYAKDSSEQYGQYQESGELLLPVVAISTLYPLKKVVTGIDVNGAYLAVPKEEMKLMNQLHLDYNGIPVNLMYLQDLGTVRAYQGEITENNLLHSFDSYWFAWYAFHPDTKVLDIKAVE